MKSPVPIFFTALMLVSQMVLSQERQDGPVINGFGSVFTVPSPTYPTDTTQTFRIVIEVDKTPEDKSARNAWIETAARYLNMHAQAGIPADKLFAAVVVHGQATPDLLSDELYNERFGVPNPNTGLIASLIDAGVPVILCGQSSNARKVPIEHSVPGVKLALSAMTALLQFQEQGYHLIKF